MLVNGTTMNERSRRARDKSIGYCWKPFAPVMNSRDIAMRSMARRKTQQGRPQPPLSPESSRHSETLLLLRVAARVAIARRLVDRVLVGRRRRLRGAHRALAGRRGRRRRVLLRLLRRALLHG